jgi:hypothetical protein
MSVRQLAKTIGVHHTYISKVELGIFEPPPWNRMLMISQVLDSPALLEAGEQALVENAAFLIGQLGVVLDGMPPDLRTEIGIRKFPGWQFIRSGLLAKLEIAGDRRARLKKTIVRKAGRSSGKTPKQSR